MIGTGKIIVLAYPDTFVKMSSEWQCKVMPFLGLGTFKQIKAGHAAMILIENKTGLANYYDFGRYVTPDGLGRVRSCKTDHELIIPITAKLIGNGPLENLSDFLLWLDANPDKTHGDGRLVASVCEEINFKKAQNYILKLQEKGSIPYGAFVKEGSNCARFVTETVLVSTENEKIKKGLNYNKRFTPSAIGNVEKSANSLIYEVVNGEVNEYLGSAFKENLINYFHRQKKENQHKEIISNIPSGAQKLNGIGSSAWFIIELVSAAENIFQIKRYNDFHQVDYVGLFKTSVDFDINQTYKIAYDSNCEYCHVIQHKKKIKFSRIKTCPEFIQLQKAYSA